MDKRGPLIECILDELEKFFNKLSGVGRIETGRNRDDIQNAIMPLLRIIRDGDLGDSKAEVIKRLHAIEQKTELDINWSAAYVQLLYILIELEE